MPPKMLACCVVRHCGKCKQTKLLTEFYPQKRRPVDGRYASAWCRACHSTYARGLRNNLVKLVTGTSVDVAMPLAPIGRGQPQVLKDMGERELAYLAGIIDGEGCINIGMSTNITINLHVVNTSGDLILWLYNTVGGSWRPLPHRDLRRKAVYHWGISGAAAVRLLCSLLPYLVIKTRQAEGAIACHAAVARRDMPAAARHAVTVRTLNVRGSGDVG